MKLNNGKKGIIMIETVKVMADTIPQDSTIYDSLSLVLNDKTNVSSLTSLILNFDYAKLFQTFKDIALIIIAFWGLKTWRRQLKGKTEYKLARRLLKRVHELRDALFYVRMPFFSPEETANAIKELEIQISEKDKNSRQISMKAVFQVRWNKINDAQSNLKVEELEAEVLWDLEVTNALKPLYENVRELFKNINLYILELDPEYRKSSDKEERKVREGIVFSFYDNPEDDEFRKNIQKSVALVEKIVKPYLKL